MTAPTIACASFTRVSLPNTLVSVVGGRSLSSSLEKPHDYATGTCASSASYPQAEARTRMAAIDIPLQVAQSAAFILSRP
jgi:hypothetical protein